MKKNVFIFFVALFFFPAVLSAKSKLHGCVDSPENATAVLGLVVSATGIGFVKVRNWISAQRNSANKEIK